MASVSRSQSFAVVIRGIAALNTTTGNITWAKLPPKTHLYHLVHRGSHFTLVTIFKILIKQELTYTESTMCLADPSAKHVTYTFSVDLPTTPKKRVFALPFADEEIKL